MANKVARAGALLAFPFGSCLGCTGEEGHLLAIDLRTELLIPDGTEGFLVAL